MDYVLGIDIGGTNTKIGLVDHAGVTSYETSFPTRSDKPVHQFVDSLYRAYREIPDLNGSVKAIGIGAPNANFHTGHIEKAPNLRWGESVPMAHLVSSKFDRPTYITNDANAAAMGEKQYGVARGMKDFIVLTLGTGLGSGIVANGELVIGKNGFAGELGHVIAVKNGRQCGCGRKGCLETYISATGIKRTAFEMLANAHQADSSLKTIPFETMTAKDIAEAALQNDPIALQVFDFTGQLFGEKLADFTACFNPEAFILFGGLVNAGELLTNPIRQSLEQNLMNLYKGTVKVMISGLTGQNIAVLGAAAMAWEKA